MSSSQGILSNADGGQIQAGVISRILKWLGANITLTGSGSAVVSFPASSATIPGLSTAQTFTAKQTLSGGISRLGDSSNIVVPTGIVGELVIASVAPPGDVGYTNNSNQYITTVSLTAGDWEIDGIVGWTPAGTTVPTQFTMGINTSYTSPPTSPNGGAYCQISGTFPAGVQQIFQVGTIRVSIASTTIYYLTTNSLFTVSTMEAFGCIRARRIR